MCFCTPVSQPLPEPFLAVVTYGGGIQLKFSNFFSEQNQIHGGNHLINVSGQPFWRQKLACKIQGYFSTRYFKIDRLLSPTVGLQHTFCEGSSLGSQLGAAWPHSASHRVPDRTPALTPKGSTSSLGAERFSGISLTRKHRDLTTQASVMMPTNNMRPK